MKGFLLICSIILIPFISAQSSEIDSLLNELGAKLNAESEIELLTKVGKIYLQTNIDSAIYFYAKAEKIASKNQLSTRRASLLKYIGGCYHIDGNLNEAKNYYTRALEICLHTDSLHQDIELSNLCANLYNNLAIISNVEGRSKEALQLHFQGEALRLKFSDFEGLARYTYPSVGSIYMELGELSRASVYFYKSMELWEEINDKAGLADAYDMVGVISEKQMDFEAALENYKKSLAIREELGDDYFLSYSYNNIGVAYFHLEKFDKSLEYYSKSLELKEKLNDRSGYRNTLINIGLIYQTSKEFKTSLEYFQKAIEISKELNDNYGLTTSYTNAGTTAGYLKDYRLAEEYLNKAFSLASGNNYLELLKDVTENIAIVYRNTNQYQKALDMMILHQDISDSIFNTGLIKKLTTIELNYAFEKKRTADSLKTAKLNFEREIKHNEALKRKTITNYALLFGLFLIIALAYFIFRSYKLKQKSKQDSLKKKAAEIEKSLLLTQMNPHFIFNSMNSIQSFISQNDSYSAERYLSKFAKLIRFILENSSKQYISLEDEVNALKLYLELEQLRFSNKFEYAVNIPNDVDEEFIGIPPMLIQPYVENAIIHGIMNMEKEGKIEISFGLNNVNSTILCRIVDNGIGREKAQQIKAQQKSQHKSVGMHITNERLRMLNSESKAEILAKVSDGPAGMGTIVELHIPYRDL